MPRPAISPLDSCALRGGAFPYTGGKPQVVSEANDNFRKALTSSSAGNFFTSHALTPPLTAEVEDADGTRAMSREVSTGACNSCHSCVGEAGGKLYKP